MSYQDRVIRDNPVGYWSLDSSPTLGYDSSAGFFPSGIRTLNNATIGAGVVSTDILPLVSGGSNGTKITSTSTSKITITNNYDIFYKYTESKNFTTEFWISFNSPPAGSTILSIGSNITLSFSNDLATLSLTDSSGSTYKAYLDIDTYEPQFHVAIVYSNRSMYFYINGVISTLISIPLNNYFVGTTGNDFVFGPATSTDFYILDCIAFYPYKLSFDQIKAHIAWGLTNNNPQIYTIANGGGVYDSDDEDGQVETKYVYDTNSEWKGGFFDNCIVDNGTLRLRPINAAVAYNPTTTASVSATGLGLTTTGNNSALFENFNKYFNPATNTITCQVFVSSVASREAYFSIDGLSIGTLVLEKPASSLTLRLFSSDQSNVTITSGTLTTGTWNDVKITFQSSQISMTVNASTISVYADCSVSTGDKVDLYLGNYYEYKTDATLTTYPTTSPIRNFSVFKDESSRLSSLSNTGDLTLALTSGLSVSQYGEWITLLDFTSTKTLRGSKLYYTSSSSNIKAYGSPNNSTWTQQTSPGDKIPGLPLNAVGVPMYIKFTLESFDSQNSETKIDYAELTTYNSLTTFSDGYPFSISLNSDSGTSYNTYNYRNRNFNILAREPNFGLNFQSGTYPGRATVDANDTNTFQTIEFWFRIDSYNGNNGYLVSIAGTPSLLYHNNTTNMSLVQSGWSAVYINGQPYSSGTKNLIAKEIYHFVGVLSVATSTAATLNSYSTGLGSRAYATYGEVCLYPDAKNAAFALKKYNLQLGRNTQSAPDQQYIGSSDSVFVFKRNWSVVKGSIK